MKNITTSDESYYKLKMLTTLSGGVLTKDMINKTRCDLKSIVIPETVTKIGDYAFSYCELLETVKIPASVVELGLESFSHCKSLKSIIIPKSVKKINKNTFSHCESLVIIQLV